MPHGGPDWSTGGQISTVHTIEDLGELAARLGSIVTHDRRGNIIWLDDFEDGIEKWYHFSFAGGESLEWTALRARNGGFCAKLNTDAHTNDDAIALHYQPYPILAKIGLEVSVQWTTYLKTFILSLFVDNGTEILEARARWTKATNTWACYTLGGAWQNLSPTTTLTTQTTLFHTFKMVCDFPKSKYDRLIVNNTVFDLKTISIPTLVPSLGLHLDSRIEIDTPSNNAATIYFDDVIITQNEP